MTAAGQLLLADTHYHRVLRYGPDLELLGSFGAEGSGPGETPQVRELRSEYQGSLRPQLRPGILTPMQETFLHRFFAFDVGR